MGQPNGWIESYISKVPGCAKAAERYPIEMSETGGKEAGGTGLPHLGGTL
jgi:hypothetical protein